MARIARYTEQISALIEKEDNDRLKAIEATNPISMADVIRAAIRAGLPSVESQYAITVPRDGQGSDQ